MDGKPYDGSEEFKNIDYTEASKMVGMSEEDFKNQCIITHKDILRETTANCCYSVLKAEGYPWNEQT